MSLTMWTVYDHPRDYPDVFVARKFELDKPTNEVILSPDLGELRQQFMDCGLYRMDRQEGDDPVIVEVWL